jgi:hypothetical protein
MALRLAGASVGAAVRAMAAVPADQSRTQVKPRLTIRRVADAWFILKGQFIRRPQMQLDRA